MKIIIIGTAYPMRGGIAHYVALLYKILVKRGHEVKIISFKRQYPSLFFPGKTQQDTSKKIEPLPSEPLLDSIGPLSWIRTFFAIRKFNADLVIFKYWMPFFAPCYAAILFLTRLFTKTKIIYLCHNIIPHERRIEDCLLTRIGLWNVHYFIVQSEAVKNDLLHFRPRAIYKEVPHPVYEIFSNPYTREQARKHFNLKSKEKVILFFGYIRKYKGLHYLIQAMPAVRSQMVVKLLIAGEFYDDREKYLEEIQQLDLQDSVSVFDDYIPNEQVGLYFNAADVVVLPYTSATQSGIIQIAYNFNKPVITTNVGGLPEVVEQGKTGFIVPAEDTDSLTAAIIKFFTIKNKVNFANHIKEYKKQFSWDRMASEIEKIIK
ncbi:MAG: glycosyltransferase [bacterium]|nr:MAG: glycosyltransferase [bacterium]